MAPDEVLRHPNTRLSSQQRQLFYEQGYLLLPEEVGENYLSELNASVSKVIDLSRDKAKSDHQFDLEPGHSKDSPRLRRVAYVDDLDDVFWQLCCNSIVTDIAVDILGPNVRFRDLFINFKWAGGGASVKWHQDIAFYPHTNLGTCQFLLALEDVRIDQGPLQVIPGSHKGQIYEHYDNNGVWTGALSESDLHRAGIEQAQALTGNAGSLSVHHSVLVHGSDQNLSDRGRPMLVITYSAADAIPYTAAPYPSTHYGKLVRGVQPRFAHHEAIKMPLPPDWSGGYTSIFSHQHDK